MAKLSLITFLTLDGVMQAPGGPEEDPSGGFEYGGWQAPVMDEGLTRFVTEVFDRSAAFLLGRRTYDIFAGYWPGSPTPVTPSPPGSTGIPSTSSRPRWRRPNGSTPP